MTRFQAEGEPLVDRIDAILPQTQCGQCGYPGCKPYAEAIAGGEAGINQCPPGGAAGIRLLADLLGRPFIPLSAAHGVEKPLAVAIIEEAACIGCTLCIQACPVDAIVGAAKQMHTVVAQLCTGCELCIAPCPTDCIRMEPTGRIERDRQAADAARSRFTFRNFRLERDKAEKAARLADKAAAKLAHLVAEGEIEPPAQTEDPKKALIAAALARARAQREKQDAPPPDTGKTP